jgi:serine/threonine protein kinase/predicted ATPase
MAQQPHSIAHFTVLSELGRGGMGVVYKVKDTRTGALAALKMIPPESLGRAESELRFKREFRAMKRVEHLNVIRVFDAGDHEGCPYFTMELVDGSEIRRHLDGETPIVPSGKDGPPAILTPDQIERLNVPQRVKTVADLVVQVGYALAEIHSHRIVHRDLKPDNILVTKSGVVKLMDFGIAKQLSNSSEHSSGGMVVGTFKYLSPEQALGGEIDGRADLYCLGIILYELLTGRHPFYSENSVGYAYHHAKKTPPAIDKLNPGVHQGLKAVCDRLLKKDARERFATAEDLVAAIREAVGDGPQPPSDSTMRPPEPKLPFALAKDQVFAPALIGRNAEKRQIIAAAESLLVGQGALVVVNGPPGIGKTRLVKDVAAELKAKDVAFVWGRCSPQGGPYHPYIEALGSMIDEVRNRPPQELRRLLGDDGRVLARYVPSLEQLDPALRPRPAKALEPQGERFRFLAAATSFIARMAAVTPRVFVIDDLHLADELSLSLTRHLIETLIRGEGESGNVRAAPITVVATFDPGHVGAAAVAPLLVPSSGMQPSVTIGLGPLSASPIQEMLASMLGGGDIAQDIAKYLQQVARGIPGLIEERVRAWVESGELRRSGRGRQWVFVKERSDTGAAPVIVDVRTATFGDIPLADVENPGARRVARLSAIARDVAERIAVLGDRVAAPLLERASLRPQDELIDALDELIKREILSEDAGGAGFRFVDPEDRKALTGALDDERRASLHLLAARAVIDDARRHHRPVNPEELAHHYLQANDHVSAIEQLMVAARTALQASATQTATQLVRAAQELLSKEQKRAEQQTMPDPQLAHADVELVLLRLDVLMAVNEHRECVTLAQRRLPKMQGTVDGNLVAETLLRLGASERILGELDAALEHTGLVLSRTERGGNHSLRCRAKSLCGQIYDQRGQFDVSARYFLDALELARTIGDELEEERARCAIAERRLTAGDLDEAQREFELLLQQATTRGEKLRTSRYVFALATIAQERGQAEQAEAGLRRVVEFAKPAGDRRSVAIALTAMSVLRAESGNREDALTLAAKAARILVELDQSETLAAVRIVEAQILLARRGPEDGATAFARADEAVTLAMQARAALKLAEAELCRGLALVIAGSQNGLKDIERGLKSALQANANGVALFGFLCLAEAYAVSGELDEARQQLARGLERARRTGSVRFESQLMALRTRLRL